ncbi:MAG: pilus assembly protein [Proteobacteria bacterium]|nr:pilus assembly protein [Pseudomonadota bacterium]
MYIILGVLIFLACVFVIEMCHYAYTTIRNPDRSRIRKRLRALASDKYGNEASILRNRALSEVPFLNRVLLKIPMIRRLDRIVQLADVRFPLGFFALLTIVLALIGLLGGSLVTGNHVLSVIMAALFGGIPVFYLRLRKKRRMQKFQRQLPDALELIARALRAGHAFSSGMKLAADEFDDPVGTEFGRTLDEINFGVSVSDALKNLANRVDCPDLKYFVVSVIVQRETGGNLAEIIESIAHLIRERFKLHGRIRVLAAEGKLSAMILLALPFLVILALRFTNPEYIATLVTDPIGKTMAGAGAFLMIIGVLVMRRMIHIKV